MRQVVKSFLTQLPTKHLAMFAHSDLPYTSHKLFLGSVRCGGASACGCECAILPPSCLCTKLRARALEPQLVRPDFRGAGMGLAARRKMQGAAPHPRGA